MSNPSKITPPPSVVEDLTDEQEEFSPSPYAPIEPSPHKEPALASKPKKAEESNSSLAYKESPSTPSSQAASPLSSFVEETTPPAATSFVEETTPPAGISKESIPASPPKDNTPSPTTNLPKGLTSPPKDDSLPPETRLPKGLTSPPKDATPMPSTSLPKGLTSLPKDATPMPSTNLPKGLTSLPKDATPMPSTNLPKGLTSLPKDATPLPTAPPSGILASPPSGILASPRSTTTIDDPPNFSAEESHAYEFEATGIVSSLDDAPKSQAQIRTSLPTQESKHKDPFLGKTLGARFHLHKKLGQGGMGAVYQATDQKNNDEIAIKILPLQLSTDQAVLDRFKRESRVQLSLEHPNIVRTVSAGQEEEMGCFLAMELLKGQDFREFRIKTGRKKLSPSEIVRFFDQLCAALGYTHKRGIVHRDLKPANVFLRESPKGPLEDVCLIDFGIAKLNSEDAQQLTVTGMFLGTPSYMSPEQAAGQTDIDHRSDVYSVGIMLYECLVGVPPFLSDNMVKILMDHLYTQPPPLTQMRPDMVFPPKLQKLLDRCLAKLRDKRPDSVLEISKELHEILDGVQYFEKETSETFNAEEITARSIKPLLEPDELRQEANKLLKGLGQPELIDDLMPIEEMFLKISQNLRHCEEPQLNLSELMMEVLLEDYSNDEENEVPIEEPIFSQEGLSAVLPTGSGPVPSNQTIGRMQILTINGQRKISASQTNLPSLQAPLSAPSHLNRPPQGSSDEILSLKELEQRHPGLSKGGQTKDQRKNYQRKKPDFSKNQHPERSSPKRSKSGSRALLWLLLVAVAALAAIGLYLLQRGLSPTSPEVQAPSLPKVFASHSSPIPRHAAQKDLLQTMPVPHKDQPPTTLVAIALNAEAHHAN